MLAWVQSVFGAGSFILLSLLNISELAEKKTWRGFDANGPLLWVARAELVNGGSCQSWVSHLKNDVLGVPLTLSDGGKSIPADAWKKAVAGWGEWSPKEKEKVTDCDSLPCAVKLDGAEVEQMKNALPEAKLDKYMELVRSRLVRYLKTQERKEYEFPGDPTDPWQEFLKQNYSADLKLPTVPEISFRKIDFAPGKIQPIRQVIDRRTSVDSAGKKINVWIRDTYTDHYFDSWGEWTQIVCDFPKPDRFLVVQVLLVELDLLKKTDIFSKLMQGKMRDTIEKNGAIYLDQAAMRLSKDK